MKQFIPDRQLEVATDTILSPVRQGAAYGRRPGTNRAAIFVCLLVGLTALDGAASLQLLSKQLSPVMIGAVNTGQIAAFILMALVAVSLVARGISLATLLVVATLGGGTALVVVATATDTLVIAAGACVAGISRGIATGAALAWIGILPASKRAMAVGVVYAVLSAAWMVPGWFSSSMAPEQALPAALPVGIFAASIVASGVFVAVARNVTEGPQPRGRWFDTLYNSPAYRNAVLAIVISTAGGILLRYAVARIPDEGMSIGPAYRILEYTLVMGPLVGGWLSGRVAERTLFSLGQISLLLAAAAAGATMAGSTVLGLLACSMLIEIAAVPLILVLLEGGTTQQRLAKMLMPIALMRLTTPYVYSAWSALDPRNGAMTGIGLACAALMVAAFLAKPKSNAA